MDKKEYLNRLLKLNAFLKEHPEQIKVYSDLHLNQQIQFTKYEIMLEEDKTNEQAGLFVDGFKKTDFNPFS